MIERDDKGRFVKGYSGWYRTEEAKLKMKPTQFKKGHKINVGREMPISGVKKSVESRILNGTYEKISKTNKERMTNKSYEEIYGIKKAIDIKQKIGLKSLGRIPANKNKTYEEFFGDNEAKRLRGIIKENRKKQIFPMKDTKIELKIQKFLIDLKIEFIQHYYTSEIEHSYQCDILIPVQKYITQKTIIECDGDYWHSNPIKYPNPNKWQKEQIEEDKIRTKELIKQGFRVIRLWENKIKQIDLEEFKEVIFI